MGSLEDDEEATVIVHVIGAFGSRRWLLCALRHSVAVG